MATTNETLPLEVQCALGRIFRMMQRPSEPGDIEMYVKCRAIVLDYAEEVGIRPRASTIGVYRSGWNFGNTVVD